MAQAAASRYARALADIVLRPSFTEQPKEVFAQLQSFEAVLEESADLRTLLLSPAVSPAKKHALIARLGEALGFSKVIQNFLRVVIDHRRLRDFGSIREAFEAELNERLGILAVEIQSARPLGEGEKQALEKQLGEAAGKEVQCRYAVDDRLIGGVIAKVGSTVLDGSIRGRLEDMRERLVGAGA